MKKTWKVSLKAQIILIPLFTVASFSTASFFPTERDSVNFLMGVENYDPVFHAPHFPGYPVYIAAGKLLNTLTASPETALVLLSILSAILSLAFAYLAGKSYGSNHFAPIAVTVFVAVNPLFFEASHTMITEVFGLSLLLASIYTHDKKKPILAGILMGLLLGVRLSWWPFPLAYLMFATKKGDFKTYTAGMTVGVLVWFIPQVAVIGFSGFVETAYMFVAGHFTQWGGAVTSDMAVSDRFFQFMLRILETTGLYANGSLNITAIPITVFLLFTICKTAVIDKSCLPKNVKLLAIASIFYLVWVFFGQNVSNVRHFFPLVPLAGFLLLTKGKNNFSVLSACLIIYALTIPTNFIARDETQPSVVRLMKWIEQEGEITLYCGETERFFDRYPSKTARVVFSPDNEKLMGNIGAAWPVPENAFICSDVYGAMFKGEPAISFNARKGNLLEKPIKVYPLKAYAPNG